MKKFFKVHLALLAIGLIVLSVCSCGDSTETETTTQTFSASDDTQVVTATTEYDKLVIEEGAYVTSESGSSLTLTVDGVEQQGCSIDTVDIEGNAGTEQTYLAEGTWEGDVVITVTENIQIDFSDTMTHYFRAALYVEDGAVVEDKSVTAAIASGSYDDDGADAINITSVGEGFNGIFVNSSANATSDDDSFSYNITYPVMNFTGNGINDFAGYGALIMADGYSEVTVDNADLTSSGAARTAVFAGGNASITVTNSTITSKNGTLPDDYSMTVASGKMSEIPWALGCTGNNRSTNLVDNAAATYENCTITTEGWGSLSTDMADTITLTSINNKIQVTDSGYGSYTIGQCEATYTDTDFIVPDMAVIHREGNITFDGETTVNSGRYGIMQHGGCTGDIYITDDSTFVTAEAINNAKGSWPSITIDSANVTLTPANGILFQFVEDDDSIGAGIGAELITMGTLGTSETLAEEEDTSTSSSVITITNASLSGDIVNGANSSGTLDGLVTVNIGECNDEGEECVGGTLTGAITTSGVAYGWDLAGYASLLEFFKDVYQTAGYTGSGKNTYNDLQGVDLVGYVEFTYGYQYGNTTSTFDADYGVAVTITK
ncbi:MAG: hypothetical protein PVI54_16925, partial [Desulfobacteraceae bacterium]